MDPTAFSDAVDPPAASWPGLRAMTCTHLVVRPRRGHAASPSPLAGEGHRRPPAAVLRQGRRREASAAAAQMRGGRWLRACGSPSSGLPAALLPDRTRLPGPTLLGRPKSDKPTSVGEKGCANGDRVVLKRHVCVRWQHATGCCPWLGSSENLTMHRAAVVLQQPPHPPPTKARVCAVIALSVGRRSMLEAP
jgi:hypothetical protein